MRHADLEEGLGEEYELPPEAASVRVALDRGSLPLEEAVPGVERAQSPEEPGRQGCRQFRLAYCATVTLPDREGKAVHPVRDGRRPQGDLAQLCAGVAVDVRTL